MRINWDTIKKLMLLIFYTVVLLGLALHFELVYKMVSWSVRLFMPFFVGAAIAFILNVPMRKIEALLEPVFTSKGLRRPISLVLTLLGLVFILGVVFFMLVPELTETLKSLAERIPQFFVRLQGWAETAFEEYPELIAYLDHLQTEMDWNHTLKQAFGFVTTGAGTVLSSTFSAALSIASGLTSFSIAFIFAIYILLQKETLSAQAEKLLRAYLPESWEKNLLRVLCLTEQTFSRFLAGQCTEAVILGMMFFVSMSVLRLPYALLIGVLIAFTALIPIFGAFIGLAVGAFLIVTVSPMQTLWFIVLFFVLQQIEGNLIYPHVVGGTVGLPSIWVLAAVSIGGSMLGIVGMLIFIPLCSVLYALVREDVNRRIDAKNRQKPVKEMESAKEKG